MSSTSMFGRLAAGLFALSAIALATPAGAHEYKLGALEIGHPWSRATPPGAKVGGGYLTVTNGSDQPDRLIGVSSPVGKGEIHQMSTKDGVMTMRAVEGGVDIPAKGTLALEPGGYHLMFQNLNRPLKQGERFPGTLTFEKAGTVTVDFAVEAIGGTPGKGNADAGAHQHH